MVTYCVVKIINDEGIQMTLYLSAKIRNVYEKLFFFYVSMKTIIE